MRGLTNYRQSALFIITILSLLSLFVSRAGLSITMGAFAAVALIHKDVLQQLKHFIRSPFLAGITLLFLIPLVSGMWSENLAEWAGNVRLKIPLLLFPLAFAGSWQFSKQQWYVLVAIFLSLVFAGTVWSFFHYIQDAARINEEYLKSKSIATPLGNDHVRFSWLVAAATIVIAGTWKFANGRSKYILVFLFLWFAVYIHILAARTGMVSFYMCIAGIAINLFMNRRTRKFAIGLLLLAIIIPVLSYILLPTFRNRILYIKYDLQFITEDRYIEGGNDGNRYLSYKAGAHIMKNHPFGIGSGDITDSTYKWYSDNVPGMVDSDRLYPSSEWLVYGMTAGWLGMILFTIVMIIPFFIRQIHERIYWWVLNGSLAFSFLFDVGLEVQYGIFLYVFLILWWWKYSHELKGVHA